MFLKKTLELNAQLVKAGFDLHQNGDILPDTYLIDMDTLLANAALIRSKAAGYNIKLYFMLKQLGRNPYIAKKLSALGYDGAVAVDFREAEVMMRNNIPIGNAGHLVQVPQAMLTELVAYNPAAITVYSLEKTAAINAAAGSLGKIQNILLRVSDSKDSLYSGQTAGFDLSGLNETIGAILKNYPNIRISGVTSFPCYLYNEETGGFAATENLGTVLKAAEILKELGITPEIINTPSSTCTTVLDMMHADGGNCGEPGHGLTGTTPAHAVLNLPEKPCVLYISEVSHNFNGKGYCFGGGHYRRSHMKNALVGKYFESAEEMQAIPPKPEFIDYHFELSRPGAVGHTAVMAFRYQIFTTRSNVALVEGLSVNKPVIAGIYDSLGNKK